MKTYLGCNNIDEHIQVLLCLYKLDINGSLNPFNVLVKFTIVANAVLCVRQM